MQAHGWPQETELLIAPLTSCEIWKMSSTNIASQNTSVSYTYTWPQPNISKRTATSPNDDSHLLFSSTPSTNVTDQKSVHLWELR